ncbi:hypothetical protein [Vibrio crassostreae]|uniref:hypothetical protein n=1 Tax=Vibrio crassostreae TaxID=246167 RepID=UPI001B3070C8|nr:hypothetical protein [Vibrio crassostreae]CAK2384092.1 conserved hypothetical protein [Vibrio crassostreae]CAK2444146.1 conserved hypothetical protein [Vibrio crassostreae]CAK2557028.1 conserved hypothetical protein [Vibrio crassostreae]CAK2564124.1 conserved hypothetical protein [Vibrio crassostreae]CAK2813484.1 conserved hypothetical protein [Vibrio crassostreae]
MASLKNHNKIKDIGSKLITQLRHNSVPLDIDEVHFQNIRQVIDLSNATNITKDLSMAIKIAHLSCIEITHAIESIKQNRKLFQPSALQTTLDNFIYLLSDELNELTNQASDQITILSKQAQQAEASLKATLHKIEAIQEDLVRLDSETEQRIIEKTQRLLDEAQRSIQKRVDDSNDKIRSTLQSVRDELNIHTERAEDKINKIVASAEHKSQIHTSDINDLFKIHEKESANRIQIRIQNAEAVATDLAKKINQSQQEIEDLISIQKSSLKQFTQETRNEVVNKIDGASSSGMMEIQQAQTSALSSIDEKVNQNINSINKRIDKEVLAFESKRKDMDKLLEKVGLAKDADVTISQANAEEKIANELRTRGLIAMYCSIVVLVFFFADYIGLSALWSNTSQKSLSDLTLEAFAIRFMTVLLLSSPAIYMLKESAVHRAKENLYRQRGTQLLTIRGYLSDLPDKERTEVKQELAKNFFSFHDGKTDTQNVPDFIRDMKEAVGIAKSLNGQTKTVSQRFGRKQKQ